MRIILADINPQKFYPLCLTRPVGDLRAGTLTISEKWEYMGCEITGYLVRPQLHSKWKVPTEGEFIVDASLLPNKSIISALRELKRGEELTINNKQVALKLSGGESFSLDRNSATASKEYSGAFNQLKSITDLFTLAGELIRQDFDLITRDRASKVLGDDNNLIGPVDSLFIEEGAVIQGCILNTSKGPIYIGEGAEVMEGSLIRGPFSLGRSATLKMGSKIYGPTVIGPFSKVGGEVSNSVIQAYSNKGHDGFLGNSVLGEWCNLGADTNTSNLKNNYGEVKIWEYESERLVKSGLTFCGLIMGDHSKCSINTMFNTGTTVGVFANIFGEGFPPKFIPSFSWGGKDTMAHYEIDKAFEVAEKVCARRGVKFTGADRQVLKNVLTDTARFRN